MYDAGYRLKHQQSFVLVANSLAGYRAHRMKIQSTMMTLIYIDISADCMAGTEMLASSF